MPREQINYPNLDQGLHPNMTEDTSWHDPAVHVGWTPNGEKVQVAFEADPNHLLAVADGDRDVRRMVWSPVLSRDEVNRLIKTLRRARDAAYGVDA